MRKWFFWAVCITCPLTVSAHEGPKDVRSIDSPRNRSNQQWTVIDNLGLFIRSGDSVSWVCDEGLTPLPGLNAVVPMGARGETWLVGTRSGLRRSVDNGCSFLPPVAPLDAHVIADISAHPSRLNEAIISTQTLGMPNDLFLTEDEGATWSPVNLSITGRIRAVLRAPSNPERVFLIHAGGALSSDDGGRTFIPFALGPPELLATGTDIDLLAIHPGDPEELYAAYASFPESILLRSRDGGQTWDSLLTLGDVPDSLAVHIDGQTLLLSTPVLGVYRSADGGAQWTALNRQLDSGTITCLMFDAEMHLWACARRSEEALLIRSEDTGTTWQTILDTTLTGVLRRDVCSDGSESEEQCNYTCDDFPATCSPLDSGVVTVSDASAAGTDSGRLPAIISDENQGCTAAPASVVDHALFLLCMVIGFSVKRRRQTD